MSALINAPHKLWTREEVEKLESSGAIDLGRYELIEGKLIPKVPKTLPHMRPVMFLLEWLTSIFGNRFVMQEPSIDVSPEDYPTSQPEPDVIVLTIPFSELTSRPRPDQIRLLVEVSVSSLAIDSKTKAALYARAEILEYWVLDVTGRRMLVHRDPAEGRYRSITTYNADEFVTSLAATNARIRVADLF